MNVLLFECCIRVFSVNLFLSLNLYSALIIVIFCNLVHRYAVETKHPHVLTERGAMKQLETSERKMKLNTIYCGDCAQVLAYFPERSIDLIYIDPPFFSNKQYEIIWGNGYELRAFEDRWKGGIKNYIAWMEPKIRECYKVLKPTGSMYLHCDWHADAHLRLLMDRVFGENSFRNEIIWCYTGASSPGQRQFPRKHDVVFWYSKGENGFSTKMKLEFLTVKRLLREQVLGLEEDGQQNRFFMVSGQREPFIRKEKFPKIGGIYQQ